jgi:hypothetical protein
MCVLAYVVAVDRVAAIEGVVWGDLERDLERVSTLSRDEL